jgi:hypothetical protein
LAATWRRFSSPGTSVPRQMMPCALREHHGEALAFELDGRVDLKFPVQEKKSPPFLVSKRM